MAALFALIILMLLILVVSVRVGLFGKLPTMRELASVENQLSSEIYADDGRLLGKFFIYDRSHASIEQISPNVIDCLIATEDARFYEHSGVDLRSLARVLLKSILLGDKSAGGGSTISQQLAKNLYSRKDNGFLSMPVNKIREMIVARRLEKIYSKQEILTLYLNTVPFGDNVYGISASSLRFFNKNAGDLTIEESAVLVGMLKATNLFNPRLYPENALQRRNIVIGQLQRYDYINKEVADSLRSLPLQLQYNAITHNQGPAPYFREMARMRITKILDEYNNHNQTNYNLFTDGLKIYTTLDYDLQLMAEQAIRRQVSRQQKMLDEYYKNISPEAAKALVHSLAQNTPRYHALQEVNAAEKQIEQAFTTKQAMELFSWDGAERVEISPLDSIFRMQKVLHSGLVSIDPGNGYIKAWVGGNDYRFFQFDQVLSQRQAGSAFKPFLYATALQQGIDPCEYVSNEQRVFAEYEDWTPTNVRNEYEGYYSMSGALAHSVNTIAAYYVSLTGVMPVIETATRAGIKSLLPRVPSLALGTANVNLLELTSSYATFLNDGIPVEPEWLLKIEDKNGREIYRMPPREIEPEPAFGKDIAMMTRQMMQAVVDSGTAASLRYGYGLYSPLAGKTGTTQNGADTWFVGFTPGLVTGVWTGFENPAFVNIYQSPLSSGGSAVPVWGDYHTRIQQNAYTRKYIKGSFTALPDSLSHLLACNMYLEELPPENLWERLFKPNEKYRREKREQKKPRSRLRQWLENIF